MGRWTDLVQKIKHDIADCKAMIKYFPTGLYTVFLLKFLESYGYFALSQILVIYLHDEFGASDIQAGAIYGFFGAAITGWGLTISWLNDNIGVRRSLMLGFTISAAASTMIACARNMTFLLVVLFFVYPFGLSMGIPMLNVAIKRYTSTKTRGFAFGIYYSVMNLAALLSGPAVDGFNVGLGHGTDIFGAHFSGYRLLIFTCTFCNLCSIFFATYYLQDIKMEEDAEDNISQSVMVSRDSDNEDGLGLEMKNTKNKSEESSHTLSPMQKDNRSDFVCPNENSNTALETSKRESIMQGNMTEFKPKKESPWTVAKELFMSPTFRRFAVLTLLLVNLRAIFRHLDATQPTYLVRCFGDDVLKGMIYAINPFMIIILTPIVAGLTKDYDHFDMIKWGGYLSAFSPFFPAMSTSIWANCMMNVLLSLGEAIWSPRLYQYTMNIAPEGREASFSALASAPLFAAKIPVGLMSGYLLSTYIDEDGCDEKRAQLMWLIIALCTLSSPILITLFDTCLREPIYKKEKNGSADDGGREHISEHEDEGKFLNES